MRELKEELRKLYPNYLNNNLIFEEKKTKCQESISQACKRAHAKLKKDVTDTNSTIIIGHVHCKFVYIKFFLSP